MSLPLAIALNVICDLGLLGGLAWLMSRPARLAQHAAGSRRAVRLVPVDANRRGRPVRTDLERRGDDRTAA